MNALICQGNDGAKAFKGKGAFRDALITAESVLHEIHDEMESISAKTRAIAKRPFYLELHKSLNVSVYHVWKLRWRLASGRNSHVMWETVQGNMRSMAIGERNFYEQCNERMGELNAIENVARTQCKWIRLYLNEIGEPLAHIGNGLDSVNKKLRAPRMKAA